MEKRWILLLLGIFLCFFFEQSSAEKSGLGERFQKWLEEEAVYIISPVEKEVFLKLKTDREKELFIEAFWKHRDPTPGIPENEFKIEHYRRISYANHFFGRGLPKPGWKTDRGRMYIILGEPNDIQRFEGKTQVYPTEVWFYQGKTNLGLPPGFHLVFFQERGAGEYKLYSPLRDGPQGLLTSYFGDPLDYQAAYEYLREFEPELAEVSLTLIPGERSIISSRPAMSSDILIQRVEGTPLRQIEEKYAQKFLEYKDIVEVEYSANYIDSDSLVEVIKDPSGIYFVHYAVEPERLSVNQYQNKYYTTLRLNGTVADQEGKAIYQFEKEISFEFDQQQIKEISRRPLSLRDMFPLIPGEYSLSILVKNEASKEFTSLERRILVPGEEVPLQMTSLLLGYRLALDTPEGNRLRPFQLGPYRLYIQPNRTFLRMDELAVVFQVHGLSQGQREEGEVRFTIFKEDEELRSLTRKIAEFPGLPNFLEKFPLADFLPAHYRLQVALVLDGREVLSDREEFDITHQESIPRPWTYSKLLAGPGDPVYGFVLGTQLFNSGRVKEAQAKLEVAYRSKPESVEFALSLARTDLALEEYGKVDPVLLPFLSQPQPPPFEVFFLLGKSYQKAGKLDKAVEVFDKAISHHGLNTTALNALGECYFQLGVMAEALAAWQKSLEINPDQPEVKKYLEAIKEKK